MAKNELVIDKVVPEKGEELIAYIDESGTLRVVTQEEAIKIQQAWELEKIQELFCNRLEETGLYELNNIVCSIDEILEEEHKFTLKR